MTSSSSRPTTSTSSQGRPDLDYDGFWTCLDNLAEVRPIEFVKLPLVRVDDDDWRLVAAGGVVYWTIGHRLGSPNMLSDHLRSRWVSQWQLADLERATPSGSALPRRLPRGRRHPRVEPRGPSGHGGSAREHALPGTSAEPPPPGTPAERGVRGATAVVGVFAPRWGWSLIGRASDPFSKCRPAAPAFQRVKTRMCVRA